MNPVYLLIIAVLAGFTLPLQAGINSSLAKHLQSSPQAALISFLGGLIMMTILTIGMGHFFPAPKQILQTPPYLLIGGFLGGVMVMTAILLAPRIGAVAFVGCLITGQLLCSVVLDHYGWVGFKVHPLNLIRLIGVVFLLCGIYLIQRY